jgi:hypothetical protein
LKDLTDNPPDIKVPVTAEGEVTNTDEITVEVTDAVQSADTTVHVEATGI